MYADEFLTNLDICCCPCSLLQYIVCICETVVMFGDCVCSYRPDLYGCHLAWKDDRTFLVGWAVTVKVSS